MFAYITGFGFIGVMLIPSLAMYKLSRRTFWHKMMKFNEDDDFSDDEVFFGKITLKEVKKRILMDIQQKKLFSSLPRCDDKNVNDFKLIETSSQPNMLLVSDTDGSVGEQLKSTSDPLFNRNKEDIQSKPAANVPVPKNRDSFLEIEKYVVEHSSENKTNNLDNTLELVDFILKHGQCKEEDVQDTFVTKQEIDDEKKYLNNDIEVPKDEILSQSATYNEGGLYNEHAADAAKLLLNFASTLTLNTPNKCEQIENKVLLTPNNIKKTEVASSPNTPTNNIKDPCIFKTPKVPYSKSKSKAYKHIASPIATYIRKSPQVPLVKDVHPKKPLPNSSLIPKLVKNTPDGKMGDKENVVLPQLAYRNAKKTKVINVDKEKLPQGSWTQKLPTSSQKPVVLKHSHREIVRKPLVSQQDSFADLSLHQADVSICTQKLAFTKL